MLIIIIFATALLLSFALAPFPYLKTYVRLWRYVLLVQRPEIDLSARLKQARFLLHNGALIPLMTLLWYIDELFFRNYRKQTVNPLFIIGQPRCGTTLLHRTLAADQENFFAVRHFEWRYPFICVQLLIKKLGLEERLRSASYWPDTHTGRMAAQMHPNRLDDFEEDGIFFEERFLHHLFIFLRFPYPDLLEYLDDFPSLPEKIQKRMLNIHHRTLQKLSYLRGGKPRYYLSKEVTSHNKIPHMLQCYPDGKFIVIVRPTSDFMDSLMALVQTSTLVKTGIDPIRIKGWREAFLHRMRRDCGQLVELCANEITLQRQIRLSYNIFISRIFDTIKFLYHELNLELNSDYARYLQSLESNQETRSRGYEYPHQEAFGLSVYDAFVHETEQNSRLSIAAKPSQKLHQL
ncbi:MAG: sulfotransferase [Halieaceae bacterium]|jgi:hypothetical protein|nr:sulfotransferase [Halieaceae bacterium]